MAQTGDGTGAVSGEKYPEINRELSAGEYAEAVRIARDAGLWRLDERRPRLRLFG